MLVLRRGGPYCINFTYRDEGSWRWWRAAAHARGFLRSGRRGAIRILHTAAWKRYTAEGDIPGSEISATCLLECARTPDCVYTDKAVSCTE